ncbi:MAG: GDP-mannose 4,6-dehydratase [Methanomassiliicoccales archaeon]|nr:GDP-mannose 4,6-dehydratase [Methanomassiliicoccales archaeon]
MSQKIALITGVTGQDGSYLVELLLSKGYQVHGIIRRASTFNTGRLDHIYTDPHEPDKNLFLHYGDLSDSEQINNLIFNIHPDEVYNLAAQSHVRVSFDMPEYTSEITGLGVTRLLEAIRRSHHPLRFYQASSSEMFGSAVPPQNENTGFQPRSPYACAKLYAYHMVKNYRDGYNIFTSNGILFNHESPRRGETFVTRKVTRAVAAILAGKQKKLYMGNLKARRDWGFAPEYVEAMWRILQHDRPLDIVVGSGGTNSVQEFVDAAFDYVGLKAQDYLEIDQRYFRPNEVEDLIADASKAKKELGWSAQIGFSDLVKIMVDADLRASGQEPIGEGDVIIRRKFPNKWWKGD